MMYWCWSFVLHKIVNTPLEAMDNANEVEAWSLSFVQEDQQTPFAGILDSKRLIFSITMIDNPFPKVVWVGDGQIVDGIVVDIHDVSTVICESIKEVYEELKRDDLSDMLAYHSNRDNIPRSKCRGWLEDSMSDTTSRYSFISNRKNHCSGYAHNFIHHIVSDAALCTRFINWVEKHGPNKIIWSKDALKKWMQTVGK